MYDYKIAVTLTCHNRREKTIACLTSLNSQSLMPNSSLDIHLVDDGCTDDTSPSVREIFPSVNIIEGDGNLYWNGGMRLAMEHALLGDPDFILWLNDDIKLNETALSDLLSTYHDLKKKTEKSLVIVGSMSDNSGDTHSYGGLKRSSWWHPLRFERVPPTGIAQQIDTMNGNCVLIDKDTLRKLGNLDHSFSHSIGDFDFGLRAKQAETEIWITPQYVGTCDRDTIDDMTAQNNQSTSLKQYGHDPKHLPIKEWKVYARRHGGFFWWIFWLLPYATFSLKSLVMKFR